jgi:dTMP kinase
MGKELRKIIKDPQYKIDPQAERFLFAADNKCWVEQVAKPALAEGKIIVCDRYPAFTDYAYSMAAGVDPDFVTRVCELVEPPIADLLMVFDCDWSTIAKLRKNAIKPTSGNFGITDRCRIEEQGDQFMRKVSSFYSEAASFKDSYPRWRALKTGKMVVTIDATQDQVAVRTAVFAAVDYLLQAEVVF